jgi:hypothetical protein
VSTAGSTEIDASTGEGRVTVSVIGGFDWRRWLGSVESAADLLEFGRAAGIGQKTEVADPAEALWKDMNEKAPDELVGVEDHKLGLVVGAIVLPAKVDATVLADDKPAVSDGDAMGVAAEILEDLLRPSEGSFGVDHPLDLAKFPEVEGEGGWLGERQEIAEESHSTGIERHFETFQEKAAKEAGENVNREEESGSTSDPVSIWCETATRHDAVQMGMMSQRLPPAMENGNHAGLSA